MSWVWALLLVAAGVLLAAAEWPRLQTARRGRTRARRRATLAVVPGSDDEFVRSVQNDLDALPTTDEPIIRRRP